jgi:uridine kinase
MFKISINNQVRSFDQKVRAFQLMDVPNFNIIACTVNNRLRELSFEISQDSNVEFLTLDNDESMKIYESSLRYLFAMATNRVFPELNIKFNYHISRSIFCKVLGDKVFNQSMLSKIQEEMERLVALDLPIQRQVVTKEEAAEVYRTNHLLDKIDVLPYRPEKTVHLYQCDGYLNYMYSYMVLSTGYLKHFKLRLYSPGILIQYPRAERGGIIPPFEDEPTYGQTLKKANLWAKTCKSETIAEINEHVSNGGTVDFVNMCETRHNNSLAELGNIIARNIDSTRVIAIAGPSSSGKTTFSHRLRIELMTRGIHPVKVSIDDYYLDRDQIQPDENGKYDFEDINTIDIDLFNQHLLALINGEEVDMPIFNFKEGRRIRTQKVRISAHSPIIIEGIHALNEILTSSIPRDQKFKIYIAPHIQTNLDNHNPISVTQFRLLRRLVRDHKFRGFDAEKTISVWNSVRRGEFKWIYENQEGVDYVFNSELSYELCVMKKHALPLLQKIDKNSEYYITANSLVKFLKYFKDIEDWLVPCNSLLREFIGESCFADV